MATTWIKAIHRSGGIAYALGRSVDYIDDPDKTNRGELVDSYECDPATAQSEFLLSKRLYEQKTGRDQGKHDVIAYHIRMSFKPGEVSAEKSLELGRELAMRWTRGRHQFIVAAHINTKNPHCHIIYNSVNLDCDGKYQDFRRSAIALRRVSDQICLEHGLSIIEKPGLSKGYNRAEYLGENKPPTVRDRLRSVMDAAIPVCKDFDGFLSALEGLGVEIKRGKQLAFKLPEGKRFIRQDTLGDDYSYDAILERIAGQRIVTPKKKTDVSIISSEKPNLLIDIQEKLQQGYGAGFEHWAKRQNLKELSKTLIFLQENDAADYDVLTQRTASASADFSARSKRIKEVEARQKEIAELQKQISVYGKTREVYKRYQEFKWSQDFYNTHAADIILHRAAKKYFDGLGMTKLPSIQSLRQEWATLDTERKKLYSGYKQSRENMIAWATAKHNAATILGEPRVPTKTQEFEIS